jgi:hypothetical protein
MVEVEMFKFVFPGVCSTEGDLKGEAVSDIEFFPESDLVR